MSRLFSMTSSTSDATICSAATITIRPMAIDIPSFSSPSAENSDALRSLQSCATIGRAERLDAVRDLRRRVDVVHAQLDHLDLIDANQLLGKFAATQSPTAASNSCRPSAKMPATRAGRLRGTMPPGESVP